MKRLYLILIAFLVGVFMGSPVWADIVEMKDGTLVNGKYMGGTQKTIRFQVEDKIEVYPVEDILAITFSPVSPEVSEESGPPLKVQKPKSASSQKVEPPQPKQSELVLAEGTRLPVLMMDTVDVRMNKKDDWFKGVLDADLVVEGTVVAPQGSKVHGQVVKAEQSSSGATLAIELRELVVGEKIIPITTNQYIVQEKSQNVLDIAKSSLKLVTRSRTQLQIPYKKLVEFEVTEPVELEGYLNP